MVVLCSALWGPTKLFSTARVPFDSPTSNVWLLHFLCILANICNCLSLWLQPLWWVLCGLSYKRKGQSCLGYTNLLVVGPSDLPDMKTSLTLLVSKFSVLWVSCLCASVEEEVVNLPAPSARALALVCSFVKSPLSHAHRPLSRDGRAFNRGPERVPVSGLWTQ